MEKARNKIEIEQQMKNLINIFGSTKHKLSDDQGEQILIDIEKFLKSSEKEMNRTHETEEKSDKSSDLQSDQLLDLPLDLFNENSESKEAAFSVGSIEDGLISSLNNLGKVDIEYISQVSGFEMKEIINSLKGVIYQNPLKWDECWYKGFETSDEYLSGNLVKKYKTAQEANKKYLGIFNANVDALIYILVRSCLYNCERFLKL